MSGDRLLTRHEVEAKLGIGRGEICRRMRAEPPKMPLPVRLGSRAIRWCESELDQWIAKLPTAGSDDLE